MINLQQKSKDDTAATSKLKKIFEAISKSKASMAERRRKNFAKIQALNDPESDVLTQIYAELGGSLCDLEEKRDQSKENIDTKILPAVKYIETKIAEFNDNIKGIKADEDALENKRKEKVKAQKNKDPGRAGAIEEEIQQMTEDLKQRKKDNSDGIVIYEKERIMNLKLILLHYIHGELAMHLQSIQDLTTLYNNLLNKNVVEVNSLDEFAKKYCGNDHNIDLNQYAEDKRGKKGGARSKSKGKAKVPKSGASVGAGARVGTGASLNASASASKRASRSGMGNAGLGANASGDIGPSGDIGASAHKEVEVGGENAGFNVGFSIGGGGAKKGGKIKAMAQEDDEFEA
ncbi:MAG: hypothetical protein MJ252_18310 [archaeon]|nr:hypothetical protein [archaeon]